jgi:peptide/nickel transport system ATP-binding protein
VTATASVVAEDLRIRFGGVEVVRGLSFEIAAGECLAIVGESGSGKSVTARSLIGLSGAGARVSARRLEVAGRDVRACSRAEWRRLRGASVGFVLQDALSSLDPLRTIEAEVGGVIALHKAGPRREVGERVRGLLADVGVPDPERVARQYPHELSGGLRQRALIATALAADPPVLVADEPTTALDVTVQAQILGLLDRVKQAGRALLLISHDLAVVARLADRVAVMHDGEIVEHGPTGAVLEAPEHPYTRMLLAAVPAAHAKGTRLSRGGAGRLRATDEERAKARAAAAARGDVPVLTVDGVGKRFARPDGGWHEAVCGVGFDVRAGRAVGLVGESGSGKTTTARIALGLVAPDEGHVLLDGEPWSGVAERERRRRRRDIQVIYQDPLSSFDPRFTVERVLGEAVDVDGRRSRSARRRRSEELLELVGLESRHLARRPLELSGGQRQRVAIARAMATRPRLIVCDEPVSALDVSIQAQVLDLLADLQRQFGVALLFISHDLGVVYHVADEVLVMKDGRVVEAGDVAEVFERPQAEYTRALLAALPRVERAASAEPA